MNYKTYHLKQMLWAPLLLIAFAGLAGNSMLESALRHDTLSIYRIVTLTGGVARLAFLGLFVMSAVLCLFGLFVLFAALQGKRVVAVSKYTIKVPKFSMYGVRHIEIPYSNIRRIELQTAGNGVFLYIHHTDGKSALAKAAFRSDEEFEEIASILSAKSKY